MIVPRIENLVQVVDGLRISLIQDSEFVVVGVRTCQRSFKLIDTFSPRCHERRFEGSQFCSGLEALHQIGGSVSQDPSLYAGFDG